jgi:hypothetical protein
MTTVKSQGSVPATNDVSPPAVVDQPDLLAEILAAEADFERGDYIELTVEQLEHCAATGESPWPDDELRT